MSPISELRGGIPLGIALGYHPILVMFTAILFNALVYFPLRWFCDLAGKQIIKVSYVRKSRERVRKVVDKYGLLGLAIFVGIPLPLTGVYTATIASWSLGFKSRESVGAIAVGVMVAGVIVTGMSLGVEALWRLTP